MTRILLLLPMLMAVGVGYSEDPPSPWRLVWSDEFEGKGAPDSEKWGYEVGFVRNREAQYYTEDRRDNARLEDGCLVIEARKEPFPNARYEEGSEDWRRNRKEAEYTSASVTSRGKADWTYGRIEVRARLPKGRGVWPAIWTLGADRGKTGWPACGELDIMEYVGHKPGVTHANVHVAKYNHTKGNGKGKSRKIEGLEEEFHVWSMDWSKDRIEFFIDGEKLLTYENEGSGTEAWPFDKPQYLILNLAVGGAWGGQKGIDDSIFPRKFLVDYVRVYERVGK